MEVSTVQVRLIYCSCTFKWLPGPWEACSTTCGRFGMQLRQLYCVHSGFNGTEVNRNNELEVYRTMVQPSICKTSPMPTRTRECNRIQCPGRWIFTDWSTVRNHDHTSTCHTSTSSSQCNKYINFFGFYEILE